MKSIEDAWDFKSSICCSNGLSLTAAVVGGFVDDGITGLCGVAGEVVTGVLGLSAPVRTSAPFQPKTQPKPPPIKEATGTVIGEIGPPKRPSFAPTAAPAIDPATLPPAPAPA